MEEAIIVIIIFANALVCRRLAYWSTVPWGPLFPFKPFNCGACLTFWYTLISLLVGSWFFAPDCGILIALAPLVSFINFLYIKLKFKINE